MNSGQTFGANPVHFYLPTVYVWQPNSDAGTGTQVSEHRFAKGETLFAVYIINGEELAVAHLHTQSPGTLSIRVSLDVPTGYKQRVRYLLTARGVSGSPSELPT